MVFYLLPSAPPLERIRRSTARLIRRVFPFSCVICLFHHRFLSNVLLSLSLRVSLFNIFLLLRFICTLLGFSVHIQHSCAYALNIYIKLRLICVYLYTYIATAQIIFERKKEKFLIKLALNLYLFLS